MRGVGAGRRRITLLSPKQLGGFLFFPSLLSHSKITTCNPLHPSSSKPPPTTTKWNPPTKSTITHPVLLALEACTCMPHLKQIQAQMTHFGLVSHVFPASRVLAFCALADSGDIAHAALFFSRFGTPNTYMWNTMVRGYTRAGLPRSGFGLFGRMVGLGVEVDGRSFVFGLKACEGFLGVLEGGSVHCVVWKMGFEDELLVGNGLVHFYGAVGCPGLARKVFDAMPGRDVVSWTSMIGGCSNCGWFDKALEVFESMTGYGVEPNDVTLVAVLSACAKKGDLRMGKRIHELVKSRGGDGGLNLMNAVLDMYVKCGCLDMAWEVFDEMVVRDVFTWTSMVNGYAKSGELQTARKLFNEMPGTNAVAWNAMIAGYSQNSQPKEALELFRDMVTAGLVPMENTLVCILSACGQLGCLDFGRRIHSYYVEGKQVASSVITLNALIGMYAKCGIIDKAAEVFNGMAKRNLSSWNSMISAYAVHGHATAALDVFEQMRREGLQPDDITLVAVLSACSHGGLVAEGQEHFRRMRQDYHINPKEEHYACMIDLLSRVGLVADAYELITRMPIEPCKAAWGSLLNACSIYGNAKLGEIAARRLVNLDPEDSGNYVLLATTCANAKRWNEVRTVRRKMRERGVKKLPGHSLIEVEGEFHEFLASDESHPKSERIRRVLDELGHHLPKEMDNLNLLGEET